MSDEHVHATQWVGGPTAADDDAHSDPPRVDHAARRLAALRDENTRLLDAVLELRHERNEAIAILRDLKQVGHYTSKFDAQIAALLHTVDTRNEPPF